MRSKFISFGPEFAENLRVYRQGSFIKEFDSDLSAKIVWVKSINQTKAQRVAISLVGTASAGLGTPVGSAIKAPHRGTERDRVLGSRPSEGTPEGCKLLRRKGTVSQRAFTAPAPARA